MKKILYKIITSLVFVFLFFYVNAQAVFFSDIAAPLAKPSITAATLAPAKCRNLWLDTTSILAFLKTVPSEKRILSKNNLSIIALPMPDGTSIKFSIWESDIMEPTLAAKFPNLKTYNGQGVEDSTATIKMDWTDFGFHAMIISIHSGTSFIDPFVVGNKINYVSYFKSDIKKNTLFIEPEKKRKDNAATFNRPSQRMGTTQCVGTQLSTYRLAVACTGEYAQAATGLPSPTIVQTLSTIITVINRVDGVYRTELAIHFILVANEDQIVFTNPNTDPFTGNNNASILVDESQSVIDSKIGNANYDIGQTFSTGAGGNSEVGIVCQTSIKAESVTGLANPVGDPFSIDYVAHEIGHEFSAHHPFNSNISFCGANGEESITTNDEPGSGSTIMAYAEGTTGGPGLCGTDNLQPSSDAYFNGINFDEIINYSINDVGNSCPIITNTNNHAPIVNAGNNYTIPLSTPFILRGNATDPDKDALTFCWEEIDTGGPFGAWNSPAGNAPIFRTFLPVDTAVRYFPKLLDVINNTTTIGEIMPTYARILNFRLTARDNKSVGGGVCYAENNVTVSDVSGPFTIVYPDKLSPIIWKGNEQQTIKWNVANTNNAPVNCSNVNIYLSIDGGITYPYFLASNVANTGRAVITVPQVITSQARVRVMSVGNIFYALSAKDLSIQLGADLGNDVWKIYPSPATSILNVNSITPKTNVTIVLIDINGQIVYKNYLGNVLGGQLITFPIAQYSKGVYILKIQSNEDKKIKKVVLY